VSCRWPLVSAHVGAQLLPLGSLEKPKDVAGVVGFLTSERARWIVGENM
jgi:NAD(P)-dependent dehydrogenase (short-subunit alcohol dehydrogenase family)